MPLTPNELQTRQQTRLDRYTPYLVFIVALIVLALQNASLVNMPPVWDATAGQFAPAIYLYLTDYDLAGLLELDGYLGAGANVHSLGLMTHVTWLAIQLSEGDRSVYLPALHVLNHLFAAVTIATSYRLARPFMPILPATLVAALVMVFPLFAVQASYLYAEMPGAMCLALGALAWARRRFAWFFFWLVLACAIKSFGLVLGAFGFIGLAFDRQLGPLRRGIYAALALAIPFAIELVKSNIGHGAGEQAPDIANYLASMHRYFATVPDLYFLVICALVAPPLYAMRCRVMNPLALVSRLASSDGTERYRLAVYLLPLGLLGFIVFVHFYAPGFFPLTRYYTWVVSMLVVGFAVSLAGLLRWAGTRLGRDASFVTWGLAVILGLCVVVETLNRDGRFYPGYGSADRSFSRMERSFEYLDFYRIQQAALASAARVANGRAIFVTRGEYYAGSIPMMGYVDRPLPALVFVQHDPFYRADPDDWPSSFLVIDAFSHRFHGQHVIDAILANAREHPDFQVRRLSQHESGPYVSSVWEIRRVRPKR